MEVMRTRFPPLVAHDGHDSMSMTTCGGMTCVLRTHTTSVKLCFNSVDFAQRDKAAVWPAARNRHADRQMRSGVPTLASSKLQLGGFWNPCGWGVAAVFTNVASCTTFSSS
jgi:hypothetical protein